MTSLEPLTLPTADWEGWLSARVDDRLAEVADLVEQVKAATPDQVLRLWDEITVALGHVFAPASLLANVHPDEVVRTRAEAAEQEAQKVATALSLDPDLFAALDAVDASGLDPLAARFLERSLRDFRRSGVDRDEETRGRVRDLSERQTDLGQQFSRHIRDGVGRFQVDASRLAGLPEDFRESHPADDAGRVELSTEYPDYVPVMTFATDRSLREEMLTAFLNRAWPGNDATLHDLLEVRRELAGVLGYADWPSYDAEVKMIGSGAAIPAFVDEIAAVAEPAARRDFEVLLQRVRQDRPEATGIDGVDKGFYAEVIRREQFDVDAQKVRTYFDFTRVRRGLLDVTARLFGLEYTEVADAPRWHEDVAVYDVALAGPQGREELGRIYLDLHPRAGKYSHAAQFDLVSGIRDRQLAEGVLVCNFPRGLMEHHDVVTLFHEFGHLVHHVLAGRQEWARFAGIATEWDFVEAPSQMLEEWAWDHGVLATFATDASGEVIPAALVERMRAAEEFGKGYLARTQMFYAAVSYVLHRDVPDDLTATVAALQERYDLFSYVPGTHFQASFGHLGGYTSAYYTYMWSQVIAKDLFSAFDRDALFAPEVAARYRDRVLAAGGSKDAADLVADFLGRPYSYDAFRAWLAQDVSAPATPGSAADG